MRSATACVVGSGNMATCCNARSQRKPSEMPVSASSSGSGGPMLSISARVRIVVGDMGVLFLVLRCDFPAGAAGSVGRDNKRRTSRIGIRRTADALIKIGQTSQGDSVVGTGLARGSVAAARDAV